MRAARQFRTERTRLRSHGELTPHVGQFQDRRSAIVELSTRGGLDENEAAGEGVLSLCECVGSELVWVEFSLPGFSGDVTEFRELSGVGGIDSL